MYSIYFFLMILLLQFPRRSATTATDYNFDDPRTASPPSPTAPHTISRARSWWKGLEKAQTTEMPAIGPALSERARFPVGFLSTETAANDLMNTAYPTMPLWRDVIISTSPSTLIDCRGRFHESVRVNISTTNQSI